MPGLWSLADAANERKKQEYLAKINAVRIAGADHKGYKDAIRSIERG